MKRMTESEFQNKVISDGRGFSASEYHNAHTKMTWTCPQGHTWQATPDSVLNSKSGCKGCFLEKLKTGSNAPKMLSEDEFQIRVIEDNRGFKSSGYKGSLTEISWTCPQGHTWQATPSNVLGQKSNCPICSKTQFKFSEDEFQKMIINDGRGYKSLGYESAHVKLHWSCPKGHSWSASPDQVIYEKTGCPYCNTGGFNPNKDSTIYLYDFGNDLFGFGITGDFKKRSYTHSKNLKDTVYDNKIIFIGYGTGECIKLAEALIYQSMKVLGYNSSIEIEGFRREVFKSRKGLDVFYSIIERLSINEQTSSIHG